MCWEKLYEWHKHPANRWLHIIAGIILVFALWNHSWMWIVISILVAALGHLMQEASESKKSRKKKRR